MSDKVGWPLAGVADDDLEALKKALVSGVTAPLRPAEADVIEDVLAAQRAIEAEQEAREGDVMVRQYGRCVSKLKITPGDLIVLHVPDYITERQFNRIAKVMDIVLARRCPEAAYIVLPEVAKFGKTIKTKMTRAEIEQQLSALLGVLMTEDEG